jgi:hypothetical protein
MIKAEDTLLVFSRQSLVDNLQLMDHTPLGNVPGSRFIVPGALFGVVVWVLAALAVSQWFLVFSCQSLVLSR